MGEFDDLIDDENSVSFDNQPATSETESTNNTSGSGEPVNATVAKEQVEIAPEQQTL